MTRFLMYIFFIFKNFQFWLLSSLNRLRITQSKKKNSLVEYAYFQYFLSAAVLTLSLSYKSSKLGDACLIVYT